MAYAQINYPQTMGVNGVYSIHDIGCLLTSFCNLLERFGNGIDPASLNDFFVSHNNYLLSPEDGQGVSDDLAWTTITEYDPSVTVAAVGAGLPNTSDAIVKFEYSSYRTGNPTTHFCLVDDYRAGTIIDSWDGQVKNWNVYGSPKAWAAYTKTPQGGDDVTLSSDDVTQLYQDILRRAPDAGGLANYTGKSLDFTVKDMLSSEEYKSLVSAQYSEQINNLQNTVNMLNTELAAAQAASVPSVPATPEQIKGAQLIESLKAALNG